MSPHDCWVPQCSEWQPLVRASTQSCLLAGKKASCESLMCRAVLSFRRLGLSGTTEFRLAGQQTRRRLGRIK
jgi:hypothetical protein